MKNNVCGIDFGTSNSAMAAGRDGKTALVPLEGENRTIPSAIFFNFESGETVFGRRGVAEYLDGHEGRLMRSLKSILGSELIGESTQVGRTRMDFRQIIGIFLSHVKGQGERALDGAIDRVVLGRPVRFVDDDAEADRRAENELRGIAERCGFKEIHFEYEPLAAARDYGRGVEKEEIVLVMDIGGGTSDFSVVRLSPQKSDILANAGVHIGGTDFDRKLSLETAMKDLGYKTRLKSGLPMPMKPFTDLATWHLINFLYAPQSVSGIKNLRREAEEEYRLERFVSVLEAQRGHELADKIEKAKIALSEEKQVSLSFAEIDRGWTRKITVKDLKAAIDHDIGRIMTVAGEAVAQAGLEPGAIDVVFMTGGSTGLPGFEEKAAKAFPKAAIRHGNRFSSVATGLGLAAQEKFGA